MSPLFLLYFGIIFVEVICLSDGYDEFQMCINPRKFVIHQFQYGLKTSVDPCNDFYEHGCGNWGNNNPTSKRYERWTTFKQIQYETFHRVHELLIKEIEKDELPFIKIAKKYHQSCMNEEAIEHAGLKPMKIILKATGEWPILYPYQDSSFKKRKFTWQYTYSAYNKLYGFSNIFSLAYKRDEQDKKRKVFLISQSFYEKQLLKDTCPHISTGKMIYVVSSFVENGIDRVIRFRNIAADVTDIIKFRRKIRELTSKGKPTRMTIAELQNFYNSFTEASVKINWLDVIQSSFQDINLIINATEAVIVNKEFFREMALLLDVTEQYTIVNYLQWNMICRLMKYLNKEMRNILSDCEENCNVAPRWLTCVEDEWIRDTTSYLCDKIYISADVSKAVSKMIDEIKTEIKERLLLSPWMSNNTKNYMIDELDKVLLYIGFPKWYDNETAFIEHYKGLELGGNYFENILAIAKHERKKFYTAVRHSNIDRYSRAVYPASTAQDVPLHKIIVIPTALMRDPYFTFDRPSSLNYGAIGFIIAHELAHSLDLSEPGTWKCLNDFLSNITKDVISGKSISYGNTTLKAYFANIIGVQAAFAAFKKIKTKTERLSKLWILENVTDEQLFFLSFANIMCTTTDVRDILKSRGNLVDFVSIPEKFRVIGTLSNTKSFSEAFDCQPDSPMNPKSKCKIWEYSET